MTDRSRRDFLKGLALVPAAMALPGPVLSAMVAPAGAGPRNLILLELKGGIDGLNMIVPYGLEAGLYYDLHRPQLHVPAPDVLPLDASVGLHPGLSRLLHHYDAGRLAVVQGVGYPQPSFSHAVARRILQTGDPSAAESDGWLARSLTELGATDDPTLAVIAGKSTPLSHGAPGFVPTFKKLGPVKFPKTPGDPADTAARHAAYAAMAAGVAWRPDDLGAMGSTSTGLLELMERFASVPAIDLAGAWPEAAKPADQLQLVVQLLAADIGLRFFHVPFGGFDSHADEFKNGDFTDRMQRLGGCLDALHTDLEVRGLAQDTLVVVFSEFGRSITENASGGTDHGSVAPMLVFGDGVAGGLQSPHPSLAPDALSDQHEMVMTTDFRDVFGTLVERWLGVDPALIFPDHDVSPLAFLA